MAHPAITCQRQSRSDRGTFSASATETDLLCTFPQGNTTAENEATSIALVQTSMTTWDWQRKGNKWELLGSEHVGLWQLGQRRHTGWLQHVCCGYHARGGRHVFPHVTWKQDGFLSAHQWYLRTKPWRAQHWRGWDAQCEESERANHVTFTWDWTQWKNPSFPLHLRQPQLDTDAIAAACQWESQDG